MSEKLRVKNEKYKFREFGGITLISLVITIILLIILEGVTINLTIGENGLIAKAKKAREEYKKSMYFEDVNLEILTEQSERATLPKEDVFIESIKTRVEAKDWVKDVLMCDENFIEQSDIVNNNLLIISTKDGYEIIVNIDNTNQTGSIRDSFEKIGKTYKVKYDSNGGEGSIEQQEIRAGFSVTLKENTFTKTDYHFTGWSEDKEGTGETYAVGSKYKPEKDVTLYAVWKKDIVTISFNENTGSGSMNEIQVEKGQEIKLPENTFTKEGFNFKNWSTLQDGTGTNYNNGDNITITENTTLYAIWDENVTATVSLSTNKLTEGTEITIGGTALGSSIQEVELKIGDKTVYTKNVNSKTFAEKLSIDNLSNLINLEFYNDYTLSLKVTSTTSIEKTAEQENIKNYTIGNASNLKKLATLTNEGNTFEGETILQIANIDLSSVCSSTLGSWTPIGTSSNYFQGTYNENNKEITNMYINSSASYQGLFGAINKAKLENVIVKGRIENSNFNVGGIVGYTNNSTIESCKNYVEIYADYDIRVYCGGIAGAIENGSIINNCVNYATISSTKCYIGGIVGMSKNYSEINNSINYGSVKGDMAIGGIVGNADLLTINKCINSGEIGTLEQSGNCHGGIVGAVWDDYTVTINNSYNRRKYIIKRKFYSWNMWSK